MEKINLAPFLMNISCSKERGAKDYTFRENHAPRVETDDCSLSLSLSFDAKQRNNTSSSSENSFLGSCSAFSGSRDVNLDLSMSICGS
jgi:hypothetical protein